MFRIRSGTQEIWKRFAGVSAICVTSLIFLNLSAFGPGAKASAADNALPFQDSTLVANGVTARIDAESWNFVSSSSLVTGQVSFQFPAGFMRCYVDTYFYLENPITGAEVYLGWTNFSNGTLNKPFSALLSIWSVYSVEEGQTALIRMDVDRTCYTESLVPVVSNVSVYDQISFTSDKPGGEVYSVTVPQKVSGKNVKAWMNWYTPYSIGSMLQDYAVQLSLPGNASTFGDVRIIRGNYSQNQIYLGKLKKKTRYYVKIWTIHPVLGIGYGSPEVFTFKTKK